MFDELWYLTDAQQQRRATPKGAIRSRLEEKETARKDDDRGLEQWRKAVRLRDKGRCRVCQCKTVQTLALNPKRGEAHHLTSRADKAVRHDRRNGVLTCLACHQQLELNTITIMATAAQLFIMGTKSYINGDCLDLKFVTVRKEVS